MPPGIPVPPAAPIAAPVVGPPVPVQAQQQPQAQAPPGQKQVKVTSIDRPEGIDPVAILQERENRLANRIVNRLQDLSERACTIPDDLQIKAQIELRALRLFNFQRQLRQELVAGMRKDASLETSFQISAYKRVKRQGLREARITEKLEKLQRIEIERSKKKEHQVFLAAVIQHGKDMKEYHRNNITKIQRVNKAVMLYHANAEREQKKEQERIEKERMRRLMAEDEEGYRKLIDQKKDKRLAFLLGQTDEYIANLTEMVKQHKAEQRRKMREQKKKNKKKNGLDVPEGDETSQTSTAEKKVTVIETATGKTLTGEEAPTSADLQNWLQANPGWELKEESDDESGEDSDTEAGPSAPIPNVKPPVIEVTEKDPEAIDENQAKEVIQQAKAKVEDDEYKHQGEQNYYT